MRPAGGKGAATAGLLCLLALRGERLPASRLAPRLQVCWQLCLPCPFCSLTAWPCLLRCLGLCRPHSSSTGADTLSHPEHLLNSLRPLLALCSLGDRGPGLRGYCGVGGADVGGQRHGRRGGAHLRHTGGRRHAGRRCGLHHRGAPAAAGRLDRQQLQQAGQASAGARGLPRITRADWLLCIKRAHNRAWHKAAPLSRGSPHTVPRNAQRPRALCSAPPFPAGLCTCCSRSTPRARR